MQIQSILAADISNIEKLEIITAIRARACRDDFHAFRKWLDPKLIDSWFTQELSRILQQFIEEYVAGRRPKYLITAPPQHGKSRAVVELIAWAIGKFPDKQQVFTSYSDRLGVRANNRLRRILSSTAFRRVFPDIPGEWARDEIRTAELLAVPGHPGLFRNTTVLGGITGESLDIGYVDDPIKGRAEANSPAKRNSVWDWFTDDLLTRFADDAALLMVLTRWHVDDPAGRLIAEDPAVQQFTFPALAEPGVPLMKDDPREPGSNEALMPELKSREFLDARKAIMAAASWQSLYRGAPVVQGGEIIHGEHFPRYSMLPALRYRAMFGDTAQKAKQHNDFQALLCAGLGRDDGRLYLIDMLHERFEGAELETKFPDFWAKHRSRDSGQLRYMAIEDKASGTVLIQKLRKKTNPPIPVKSVPRSTDKYTRVMDVLGYIESGRVVLPESAPWVSDFIAEMEAFTADDSHPFDDQVDVLVDAILYMLHQGSASWAEAL